MQAGSQVVLGRAVLVMGRNAIGRGRKVVPTCRVLALMRRRAVMRVGLVPSIEKVLAAMRQADGHAPMLVAKRASARLKVGQAKAGPKAEVVRRSATKV